ncbi:GtrA family protein [uncultured Eubacterium sp.]|uniref:GtrA family protein n=1 Tax=uncultured Eubacterium sp. TaxID=165185 RepID=UPI0025D48895|nr:GtrA family protein [uncultured Eubacterium sp.]
MEQKKEDIFDRLMHLPGLRIFEKIYKKNKEVLLYLLFGGLTTIVSIGTFAWFNVGMHMNELIANVISWVFAVTFAYVTNKIWVFQSETSGFVAVLEEIAKFFGGRLATLGVEELILFVFISLLHGNSMIVKLIAQVVIVILNYIISKIFVFKNKK